ncbi:uncharacterized protein IL334_006500 [Kwoniella shivajii]|uniref:SAGA-associated factor 11 n=1 Tax=Kwoniella shivajii TaxID=564305 RepID=A0ABZ1D879_9TREE|nr:hypothetical protein IL334_006500 [Kwoniella shivajii]
MDRTTEIRQASNAILDEMINDLILTTAMSAHREIKRGRAICGTCGTRCRTHLPLPMPTTLQSQNASSSSSSSLLASAHMNSAPPSRNPSPQPTVDGQPIPRTGGYTIGPEKGTGGSTGIGSGSGKIDGNGNVFFECLVCSRSVASNRYAPHLSSCLGLNGSTRRGAARSAAVKARLGTNDRSSPSPYVMGSSKGDGGSDNGDWEKGSDGDGSINGKKKRSKSHLLYNMAEYDICADLEFGVGVVAKSEIIPPPPSSSSKRGRSPSKVPSINKKPKIGSATTSGTATPTPAFRQALPPSKLSRPPTNRPIEISQSPSSSPEKSIISITSSAGTGPGMTGRKTLPGQGQSQGLGLGDLNADPISIPTGGGDDSSDGEVDDY